MAPVTQYVFAETLELPEHFTAGSHKWLPYSAIPPFPKQINKHQFDDQLTKADNLISFCSVKRMRIRILSDKGVTASLRRIHYNPCCNTCYSWKNQLKYNIMLFNAPASSGPEQQGR